MPESFFELKEETRREILTTCAANVGRRDAVLEKDVWVCWALKTAFSIPGRPEMAFKGGTSLSKVHQAISRFSEGDLTEALSADFAEMLRARMFYEETPDFEAILEQLKPLQEQLNT